MNIQSLALSCAAALAIFSLATVANAQGIPRGAAQGARVGNEAAGPIGGAAGAVVGGVTGGVVGGVKGVVGIPQRTAVPRARTHAHRH
ncbi:hypothetical protein [Bosea sp. TAF32]|uniref:hypothetical protein n=1 Tax=Bosea sp. TAF32 TaxID=3237482 RepID=UPI003F92967C